MAASVDQTAAYQKFIVLVGLSLYGKSEMVQQNGVTHIAYENNVEIDQVGVIVYIS